jgi:hypothetical protein
MKSLQDILGPYAEWIQTRKSDSSPFRLRCQLEPALDMQELNNAWRSTPLPSSVTDSWGLYRSGTLFRDVDYGQWGLKLLSPMAAAARSTAERSARPKDVEASDIILGEFLGDQDLLVVDKMGAVLVALPLDHRAEWYRAAANLPEFFGRYVESRGEKFWEKPRLANS